MDRQKTQQAHNVPLSGAPRVVLPPPPPPPAAPPVRRPARRKGPLAVAPRWWYLLDRRIVGAVAMIVVLGTGAAALAAFRPRPEPPITPQPVVGTKGDRAKARYVMKADRLCATASARVKRMPFPDSQAEAVAYVSTGLTIHSNLLDDLEDLKAPRKDRGRLKQALRGFDRAMDATAAYLGALRRDNPSALDAAEARASQVMTHANGLARAYGFVACAEGA